jgi:lipopolysaccharide cholinephosphotransferase
MKLQTLGGIAKRADRGGDETTLFISNEQPDPRYWGLDFDADHLVYGPDVANIRDKEFPIPKNHDKWLKKTYKDYMSLPPEDKRVPMHVNVIKKNED